MVEPTPDPLAARNIRRHPAHGDARGLVFFCHGFGLYADKFDELYAQVNALGWDVLAFDSLGHGDTSGVVVDLDSIEEVAAAALAVWDRYAREKPLLLGIGTFGGFIMRRIIEHSKGTAWVPPAVFYSVEYVNVPTRLLGAIQHTRLLRLLDRFEAGYDYRALTHDADENVAFVDGDPKVWWRFKVGMALKLAHETNRFFDLGYSDDSPHAFIIGTEDTISHLPPLDRTGSRQPDFRLWKVDGGRMHMHRDRPDVKARFKVALEEALDFVSGCAGPDGRPPGLPAHDLPEPPVVGGAQGPGRREQARLMHGLMTDPIGLIETLRRRHGDLFTLRVPGELTPPITFLTTREGYATVLGLDPSVGRNGPIIDRVPALARWTPRSDDSPEHLQHLLLTGRRFLAARLRERTPAETEQQVRRSLQPHLDGLHGTVDLAEVLVTAIHDSSARLVLGDALWEALGTDVLQLVRTIVDAVDAARAATALTPAGRLLAECRATRRLGDRLLQLAASADVADHPFLRSLREHTGGLPVEDTAWMMFFAIWNACLYTGTYGLWATLDLLDHPDALAEVRHPSPERRDLLVGGIVETMRKNPISWQLRSLSRPVEVTCDGRAYRVPAGHFLSVYSHGLNRDAAVYPEPLAWRPRRYLDGAPPPLLFGTGPFSCVAQFWVKRLLVTIQEALLDTADLRLQGPLPPRMSRVHLLYPSEAVMVEVRPKPG